MYDIKVIAVEINNNLIRIHMYPIESIRKLTEKLSILIPGMIVGEKQWLWEKMEMKMDIGEWRKAHIDFHFGHITTDEDLILLLTMLNDYSPVTTPNVVPIERGNEENYH